MKQLHPKSVWLFFFPSLFQIFLFLLIFGYSIATILISSVSYKVVGGYLIWLIVLVVIMIIFSYIWAVLSYNSYRYELTENGFHKQLGVIIKKDVTIPYDRIQNIDINRGIVAQILGLSDLNIQTAGSSNPMGSGGYSGGAEGKLPGLTREDAEHLRDELIIRAKQSKNIGL